MTDDQFEDTLDDSGRLRLYTTCPMGHPTIQAFTPGEWRARLPTESFVFECLYCGAKWTPSPMQRGAILSALQD